jgi:hypothetical protein
MKGLPVGAEVAVDRIVKPKYAARFIRSGSIRPPMATLVLLLLLRNPRHLTNLEEVAHHLFITISWIICLSAIAILSMTISTDSNITLIAAIITGPLLAFRVSQNDPKAACKSPDGDELSRAIRDVSDTLGIDWGINYILDDRVLCYRAVTVFTRAYHPTRTYESVPITRRLLVGERTSQTTDLNDKTVVVARQQTSSGEDT